jgi:drug/metabolite transporter (DMT)-like permease
MDYFFFGTPLSVIFFVGCALITAGLIVILQQ